MLNLMVRYLGICNLWHDEKNDLHKDDVIKISEFGPIWTLNVSPDSMYKKIKHYNYDTYAILTIGKKFDDWKLAVHNVKVLDEDEDELLFTDEVDESEGLVDEDDDEDIRYLIPSLCCDDSIFDLDDSDFSRK